MSFFSKLSSAVKTAEKVTGVDLDGDGKSGGKKARSGAKVAAPGIDVLEKQLGRDLDGDGDIAGKKINKARGKDDPLDAVERITGKDLDGDGDVGGVKQSSAGTRDATEELEDGIDIPESTCTGNKKSLFIGINYFGTKAELRGCINDVISLKSFVVDKFSFPTDQAHMRVLTDDSKDADLMPTRANIIAGMKWLVKDAKKDDSLFMHYSGHGGSQQDASPDTDEADGKDETLCPCDYSTSGVIVDDELHDILVKSLPEGVRLTVLFDCCHSGSILDLPYTYSIDGKLVVHETDNRKEAIAAAIAAGQAFFITKDTKAAMASGMKALQAMMQGPGKADPEAQKRAIAIKTTLADVITLSGCRDEQTSADANIDGTACGACSWAFTKAFKEHGSMTYTEMLQEVRSNLHGKYSQVPQLSAGHKLRLDSAPFKM